VYRFTRQRVGGYQAMVVSVALVYLGIVLALPLLHKDNCPAAPGSKTSGSSLPSNAPCPACKFLASSNSGQIHCDATPALTQSKIPPESTRDVLVVIASPCEGSILLRGPPLTALS
jgi:hypothetical protein